jgi:hypothetical protein
MGHLPEPQTELEPGIKPNMAPEWSVPRLTYWPPTRECRGSVRVRMGQSWLSIARDNLIPDAWDLIHFNFRTEDPPAVNRYMRHYIGCFTSDDGRNFDFSGADTPGKVYLPPHGYSRHAGFKFNDLVIAQLEKVLRHYPDISWKGFRFNRLDLRKVIMALRSGRAHAVYDPMLDPSTPAHWEPGRDVMAISTARLTSWNARLFLVHEATHAMVDDSKALMYRWANEMFAYAATALYARSVDDARVERYVERSKKPLSIWRDAYILARYLRAAKRDNGRIFLGDVDTQLPDYRSPDRNLNPLANLITSIQNSATYSDVAFVLDEFDGV